MEELNQEIALKDENFSNLWLFLIVWLFLLDWHREEGEELNGKFQSLERKESGDTK